MHRRSFVIGLGAALAAPAIPPADALYGTGPIMLAMDAQRTRNGDFFLWELFSIMHDHPDLTATQIFDLMNDEGLRIPA